MSKLKRIATVQDNILVIEQPVSDEEIRNRHLDYPSMAPNQFAKKYRKHLYTPVKFTLNGKEHEIQMNACTEPFCKWFGMPQHKFVTVKGKPYRYRLTGEPKKNVQRLRCNSDPVNPEKGVYTTMNCTSATFSNWSVVEEIKRLTTNNTVQDLSVDYSFHRDGCLSDGMTPFVNKNVFYKRGKSSSNSQKWQCKTCNKITNVLPKQRQSFNYHQQRNDVLLSFAKLLLNRVPIRRTLEILDIGSSTYYEKLELLYRRCLEFLERHETRVLSKMSFDEMWLNTDKLIYNLNNVRMRGKSNKRFDNLEDKQMPTHFVVSADVHSRYVFGADVAYDWQVRMTDLESDTVVYKDDHLDEFSRKNARLRFSYAPQAPTPLDAENSAEHLREVAEFDRRKKYIDGLHVNSTYTTFAQLWLIKEKIAKVKEWRFVTDEDSSIMTALFRAFAKEIRLGEAHHFLCKTDREKTLQEAYTELLESRRDLTAWGISNGYDGASISSVAYAKLTHMFRIHRFHEEVEVDGKKYRKWARNPLNHPLPPPDKGNYKVDCTTDLVAYDPHHIARMVLQVNDSATSAFMQQMRRRLSILERPLVTARGDGKSYIYANFNPKYAQYAATILRTFYNFCDPYEWNGEKLTPAQRLGIANKQYNIKDIVYFM